TALGDGMADPRFELNGESGVGSLDEVEEELTVAFRSRQARVYDPGGLRPPCQRRFRNLVEDAAPRPGIANDPAASLAAAGLELRLHENHGLPARRRQLEERRQRLPDADERDVADDELRRERELGDVQCVRTLAHDHPRGTADARVKMAVADITRSHTGCAGTRQG